MPTHSLPLTPEQQDWLAGQIPSLAPTGRRVTASGKVRYDRPHGWAAPPGSGPANETCGSCGNARKVNGGQKDYWKCALVRPTSCPATDIRLKWPACAKWQPKHLPADTRPDITEPS